MAGSVPAAGASSVGVVRLVIARCQVDYAGRLTAHLPMATRLVLVKADGSVSVHADDRAYKPLNWMSPPCRIEEGADDSGRREWTVRAAKTEDTLRIVFGEVLHDSTHELGIDPGLIKDGVEKHLQELLAEHPSALGEQLSLVRREYPTAIGPVDLLCRDTADSVAVEMPPHGRRGGADARARHVAVEIKRKATIDAVEQLTRYLELLNRDPLLQPVRGILAAQTIVPQARTLAQDRGITCAVVDYDALRGMDSTEDRLF
jgi:RecB family endonuclease NucS